LRRRTIVDFEEPTGPWRSRTRLSGAEVVGGRLEDVHQARKRILQAVEGVLAVLEGVIEELELGELALEDLDLFDSLREHHVVQTLMCRTADEGILFHEP